MSDQLDYVALCPKCKRVIMWISGESSQKSIAKEVGDAIRRGYSVERMETESVRAAMFGHVEDCEVDKRKKPKAKEAVLPLEG